MTSVALITGAAHRIGRALAENLAADGWAVGVHYAQSGEAAHKLCADIENRGGRALPVQADLADPAATARLMPQLGAAFGPVSLLINNASRFERDRIDDFSLESWDAHLDANLRAPAILMRDFAAQSPDDGPAGCIINIIDQRVWRLTPDFSSYTISKAGLWTLTQTAAQALAPRGIRVNAIGPGPTLPNPRQDRAEFDKQTRLVPLGYGAGPEDIVEGMRYIMAAKSMTGQMIALDGGQHLAWETPDVTQVTE
ncbi:MAG: 3-oxoacyl-[acyl-carrier-protein] reductase FabG [Rhodobiaceae bacterium UBA7378]|nr:MAG: 3-oxoacyl-[acyl-carrier-protein] reductase FabG [Rhodobiaceae bacterium UBA7378]|tara:strand:+ start:140 stop:901 length:762 start_codon:yes stop_codon:yes gene_type:complete